MNLKVVIFIGLLVVLLSLRFWFFYQNQTEYKHGEFVSFTATLLSDPKSIGNQQRISANLASGERVFIITTLFPEFHYGDTIAVSGSISQRLIGNKKTLLSVYFPKIKAVKSESGLAFINSVRQKIIFMFSKSLPTPYSSLLLGVVFGVKEPMPKEFKNNLQSSGVLHVIAASGMNVTLVGGFMSSVFAFFLKRQLALALSIIGIIFYAILAGLEPSIIRASIMGILVFSSQILGRQNMARNGLFLAGFLMLFLSPTLIFDIGFQLSFLATLGLLYIRPLFEHSKKHKRVIEKSLIGTDVATTISAQLATLPILLANFGSYSVWSIVANGLVLWTVPVIMAIGGISAILGLIFMPLGSVLVYLSYPFLLYFEKIINLFGKMGETVSVQELSWPIIIGYYSMLTSCILFFGRKSVRKK